jgi:hypothetical protein
MMAFFAEAPMKKIMLSLMVVGLFVGGTFSDAQAQQRMASFSLNVGAQTNLFKESSFDNAWFTLDARLGFPVGRNIEISPEVMVAVDDSLDFDLIWLYPGAMLNFKMRNFFIGVGAVLPIAFFEGESDTSRIAPKINVGFRTRNLILTAYLFTWTEEEMGFLEFNYIGATIGYRF